MISVYIVTYKNSPDLNRNIASILASGADVKINVINNHSDFYLWPEHERAVTVLHNQLRADFSTGHLARSWNQALIHGFRDLKNPASEVVVTVQDDVIFNADWLPRLLELHRRFSFVTMGAGDAFCSYLPEAVRKIGLWDERFCNIGFQEADYFLRALIYNRERSSINDVPHGRQLNVVGGNEVFPSNTERFFSKEELMRDRMNSALITLPYTNRDRLAAATSSMTYHPVSMTVFWHKWGVIPDQWGEEHHALYEPISPSYVMYPYFEKDIESLCKKKYIVPENF